MNPTSLGPSLELHPAHLQMACEITKPPFVASGIRVGTPAVTTRGMRETDMDAIGEFIGRVLAAPDDARVHAAVRSEVEGLCQAFPLHPTA